jgi:predicted membrane channel-forming protein YqfA (hemolysin III family)
VFGYHEVFHSLVVAAVLAHYVLVWLLLDGA